MKHKRYLRVFIAVLLILLAISGTALAGTLLYDYFMREAESPATAPDNVITPEKLAATADFRCTPLNCNTASTVKAVPLAAVTGSTQSALVDSATGEAVTIKLYRGQTEDSAPFQVGNMFPGDAEEKSYDLEVSYTGSVTVYFRADIRSGYEKLAEVLKCRVEIDGQQRYDGLMRDMPAIGYTLTAALTKSQKLDYVITAYLETSVGNEYQGKQLLADFVWWADGENTETPVQPGNDGGTAALPKLDMGGHYAYIIGKPDGLVHPEAQITRGETATIFFRLLTEESRENFWCKVNPYYDVASDDWYNNAISTLTNAGILNGRSGNLFEPEAEITRGEFATIIARFFAGETEIQQDYFSDISGHWANYEINLAYTLGFVEGYPDGTFRPDQSITRAEVMAIMNRVLCRKPHRDHLLEDMIQWPDNQDRDAWYYADVQEATNSHAYLLTEDCDGAVYEIWTDMLEVRDWAALEYSWSEHNTSASPGEPAGSMLMQGNMGIFHAGSEDAQLPVTTLASLAGQDGSLNILFSDCSVLFDNQALTALLEKSGTTQISVSVKAASGAQLNEAQRKALSSLSLARVVTASVNSGTVHDFGGGIATVYVPFQMPSGTGSCTYSVLYVAEDGTLEYVDSYYLDGYIVFFAEHFSDYVIVRDLNCSDLAPGRLVSTLTANGLWGLLAIPVAALALLLIRRKRGKHHETC